MPAIIKLNVCYIILKLFIGVCAPVINSSAALFPASAKHINDLFAKWELAIRQKDGVESTVKTMEANHKAELATQSAHHKEEMTDKVAEAREKARVEGNDIPEFLIFTTQSASLEILVKRTLLVLTFES